MDDRLEGSGSRRDDAGSTANPDDNGRQAWPDPALIHMQRLAGIGAMAASIAHELTNPVSVITATTNSLRSQLNDNALPADDLGRYLEIIDQNAWRCARLLRSLREYSYPDPVSPEPADLNHILSDALTLVAYPLTREFDVAVKKELAADLPPLACDPHQITQVVINLLVNACDALGSAGGLVTIASWALPDECAVAFSVRDDGPGISLGQEEQIFEPFYTTKPAGDGTGLGLAIARKIVQAHKGRLTAENHPDGGAVFTVVLPIA